MGTRWVLLIGCAAFMALMPFLGFVPWLIAAALLPVIVTVWRARNERLAPMLCLLIFEASAMTRFAIMPTEDLWHDPTLRLLIFHLALSVPCIMLIWFPSYHTSKGSFSCLMFLLAGACVAPLLIPRQPVGDEIMALLREWDGIDRLLVSLYGQRILREATIQQRFALQMLGIMEDGMRHQLLLSLARLVNELIRTLAPQIVVGYGAGMTAICAAAWDEVRYKRVGWRDYPEPVKWHLPRGTGLKIGLLWLGTMLPYFTGNNAAILFGAICAAACMTAYSIQGIVMLWWWMREREISGAMAAVGIAAMGLFLPFVLTLAGYFDQLTDPRGLRAPLGGENDDERDI